MKKHVLAVAAYLVATFATQALSHFVISIRECPRNAAPSAIQ